MFQNLKYIKRCFPKGFFFFFFKAKRLDFLVDILKVRGYILFHE